MKVDEWVAEQRASTLEARKGEFSHDVRAHELVKNDRSSLMDRLS